MRTERPPALTALLAALLILCALASAAQSPAASTQGAKHNLTNLFFLHHSTGDGLVTEGGMRDAVREFNASHGTAFVFWDHGYNGDGLRNPAGEQTGANYAIPNDNTDPEGLWYLFTSPAADAAGARGAILASHQVVAFKSCFPASEIGDDGMLQQYRSWYLEMRAFFVLHPEKLFVVMSPPPQHRRATSPESAARARRFAAWLKSGEYLDGCPNVACFDLFDRLAGKDDFLKYEYELDHGSDDSHPNRKANETVGPELARFMMEAALAY